MKIIKNKKSQEGAGTMTAGEVIGWIIVIALLIFIIFWYSELGDKIISIFKSLF